MDPDAIEDRFRDIERRLSKLESAFEGSPSHGRAGGIESKLVENADKINTQEMIVISLKLGGMQTKDQIKNMLKDWGKVYGNWFEGGNFNGRLVKKNIVRGEEKDGKGEDMFSLTKRGEMMAEELIAKVMEG